ncbi:MAG: hypothetical protein BIFFINMI_03487 [Phycisphaerae bacterium]|nr:hypothetical protein [Phycisphaerae bacterium]
MRPGFLCKAVSGVWYAVQLAFLIAYTALLVLLAIYGVHRYHLVYLYYKNRRKVDTPKACFAEADLPRVTVQLPMFNELAVARRIIETTCAIDYPRDRLQIQVLDDSTDATVEIAEQTVREMAAAGHDIVYLHRENRVGFKAGALDEGLRTATGRFVAIFDADFVPEPDILKRIIHYFSDDQVGMVQARWGHINRDDSMLTRGQAIFLDGHHIIENTARNRAGMFFNFAGTAGVWRREAIEDAGGWQHDTLTEDLDLSYRAQLAGWRFVYLPDVISPAELPPEMLAFKQQQFRWTKGGVQTALKLLPRVLKSRLPLRVKIEAWFHLTGCFLHLGMVMLALMLFPAFWIKLSPSSGLLRFVSAMIDFGLFLLATCSASTFYMCSQREIFRTWRDKLKYLPFLMSLGIGISVSNSKAILEALFRRKSDFIRTPKFGASSRTDRSYRQLVQPQAPAARRRKINWVPWIEFGMGCYMAACVAISIARANAVTISLPFLLMFTFGYFYVSLTSFMSTWSRQAYAESESAPAVVPADGEER